MRTCFQVEWPRNPPRAPVIQAGAGGVMGNLTWLESPVADGGSARDEADARACSFVRSSTDNRRVADSIAAVVGAATGGPVGPWFDTGRDVFSLMGPLARPNWSSNSSENVIGLGSSPPAHAPTSSAHAPCPVRGECTSMRHRVCLDGSSFESTRLEARSIN